MGKRTEEKNKGNDLGVKSSKRWGSLTSISADDIDQISDIEKLSFSLPWSKDAFREILMSSVYRAMVARDEKSRILGYIVFYKVADEAHIMNVVTNPKFRRNGVAQDMLDHIHSLCKKEGAKSAYLELRRSNYPAYRLYKKKGYVYVGLRRGYYEDNQEDAILMKKNLE